MKVKCIINNYDLIKKDGCVSFQYPNGYIFDLKIGVEKIVYGIFNINGDIEYLLVDDDNLPSWYPAKLFTISDKKLFQHCFFSFKSDIKIRNKENIYCAIFGYKELAEDFHNHDALVNLDNNALEIFYKRKAEIDESEEMYSNKINDKSNLC